MKENMSEEVEYLNYIYKNAEMGVIGIDDVIERVDNPKFSKVLKDEREEYQTICNDALNILKKYGEYNEEVGVMAKMGSKMMSEVKMLRDNTDQTIAKMMMEGTNKGIIEITEKLNAYHIGDAEIVVLANRYTRLLERNVDELKKYL